MRLSRLESTLLGCQGGPFLSPENDGGGGGGGGATGPAGPTGATGASGTAGTTGATGTTGTSSEGGEAHEAVSILIDGKTYLLQDHAQRLIGTARTEGRNAGKTEAEQAAQMAAAREKGDLEGIITGLETRVKDLEAEIAKRDHADLRAKVAAEHKLVGDHADLADLIVGDTEAEMKAAAKKLADRVLPKQAADTEAGAGAGKRRDQQGQGNGAGERQAKEPPKSAVWMPAGAVTIPD